MDTAVIGRPTLEADLPNSIAELLRWGAGELVSQRWSPIPGRPKPLDCGYSLDMGSEDLFELAGNA